MLQITSFTVGPFAEHPYLLVCSETRQAWLIDPGAEAEQLWQALQAAGATLTAIVLTHAHLDHVGAVEALRARANVPVYLHPADDLLLAQVPQQARMFGLTMAPVRPADHPLTHGQTLHCGASACRVLHTPGHSPGSVCLFWPAEQVLIAGDTLFQRGVGRTDLPGGDARALVASIRRELWPLPDATRVLPGHGEPTTIGEERRLNPFVGEASGFGLV